MRSNALRSVHTCNTKIAEIAGVPCRLNIPNFSRVTISTIEKAHSHLGRSVMLCHGGPNPDCREVLRGASIGGLVSHATNEFA
jgi:hypothetical protein